MYVLAHIYVHTHSHSHSPSSPGAIWTGDNKAAWDHLAASIPMLLSISVAGLPFVGADVGGFFTNPDPELLVRWYQAGAFYPFFRAHAHLDTRRREPWLFDADKTAIMREAIRLRYQLLPLWYVLFYESHKSGLPVMRPVWVEFSRDKNTYEMDDQFMVGSYLMVKPVVEQYATTTQLYLPGQNTVRLHELILRWKIICNFHFLGLV